jgi:adenylate cyclase
VGKPYLEYERRGAKLRVRLSPGDAYRIDRSRLSAARLSDDPTVSLRHAIVQSVEGDKFYLTDLNSRNGTMVNGRPITVPTLLKSGDVIRVGTYELFFYQDSNELAEGADVTDAWSTQLLVSRKLITILVADIRGYTQLTLKLGESFIGEVVGSLFKEAGRVLSSNGCWGQKYIGDAVMGVWIHEGQIPTAKEFECVFQSLMDIKQVFATLNERLSLAEPILFGVGINTGDAALGNMGSRQTPDYTALGDAVNKAFRLESATRELQVDVVLGSLTYELLSAVATACTGVQRHVVELKGYLKPEDVYATDFETVEQILQSLQSSDQQPSNLAASGT